MVNIISGKSFRVKLWIVLAVVVALNTAYAASCSIQGGGSLDAILSGFYGVTSTWQTKLAIKAKGLFWFLFGLEFSYQFAIKKILPGDIQKIWVFALTRIFIAGFLADTFLDINFYSGVIAYFMKLGAYLSGLSISIDANNLGGLSPSGVISFLMCTFNGVVSALVGSGGTTAAIIGFFSGTVGTFMANIMTCFLMGYYACVLVVGLALMLVLLEIYIVMFGGFILCGFAGSSWTINYWQRYLGYVGGAAIRIFMTALILGVILKQTQDPDLLGWKIADILTEPSRILGDMMFSVGILFFDAVILFSIPAKSGAMLSGQVSAGFGDVVGTAALAMSGGKMFANPVAGGARAGATAMKALSQAGGANKAATMKEARSLLKNSVGGGSGAGGGGKDWKSMAKEAGKTAGDAVKSQGMGQAKNQAAAGLLSSKNAWSDMTRHSNTGSGSAGAPSLNVDPHKN